METKTMASLTGECSVDATLSDLLEIYHRDNVICSDLTELGCRIGQLLALTDGKRLMLVIAVSLINEVSGDKGWLRAVDSDLHVQAYLVSEKVKSVVMGGQKK